MVVEVVGLKSGVSELSEVSLCSFGFLVLHQTKYFQFCSEHLQEVTEAIKCILVLLILRLRVSFKMKH